MTAPLRHAEPIVVQVALAERSYGIVIARGLLASLGARLKVRKNTRIYFTGPCTRNQPVNRRKSH